MNFTLDKSILITDMDNTILSDKLIIEQRDIESIKKLQELGGHFTVSTGRSYPMMKRYSKWLGLNETAVLLNGSLIYDYGTDKILWSNTLPKEALDFVSDVYKAFPEIAIELLTETEIYVLRENYQSIRHLGRENVEYKFTELEAMRNKKICKVLFALPSEKMPKLDEYVKNNKPNNINYVISQPVYLELLPIGSTKAEANRIMLELTGRADMKIFAIGDYYNDREMILDADFGVTVENAPDEIKKISKLIVSKCEDGAITDLVEYMINNQMGERKDG